MSPVFTRSCDEKTPLVRDACARLDGIHAHAVEVLRAIASTGTLEADVARRLAAAARAWAAEAIEEPSSVREVAGVVRLAAQLEAAEPRLLAALGAQLAEALVQFDIDEDGDGHVRRAREPRGQTS